MRKILQSLSILIVLFLSLSLMIVGNVFAAENIVVEPSSVAPGEEVTVTVNGLEKKDNMYNVQIFLATAQGNSGALDGVQIITHASGTCELRNASDQWSSTGCAGSGPFTFTGVLNTTFLSVDQETDIRYRVYLGFPEGEAENFFTITAANPTTAFSIQQILNPDNSANSQSNPVSPGAKVSVQLTGNTAGQFGFGISGEQVQQGTCGEGSCNLSLPIPADISERSSIGIVVIDPNDNRVTDTVYLVSAISTGVPNPSVVPTTPPPPQPPCARPVTADGKFVGCAGVATGLGSVFPTNPTEFIKGVFALLLSLSGGILLLLIIYSGYQFMTSRGDPEKIQAARERITSAIVGFLFLVFSLVILEAIGVDILRIPGFCRDGDTACQNATNPQPTAIPTQPAPTSARIPDPPGCGEDGRTPCQQQFQNNNGCKQGLQPGFGGLCEAPSS